MALFKIFIVEDDPFYGQMLLHHLGLNPDYEISLFTTGKELLGQIYKKPHLICMDFNLPDIKGDQLLKEINQRNKHLPIVVISAQEEIDVAVNLLKLGAKDYIIKNKHTKEHLWKSVIHIRENLDLKQEVEELKEQLVQKYKFESSIIGQSSAMKKAFIMLNKAIQSNINVSLTGETGTGKEVFAKAIHFNSDRKKKPLVAVNMAAIPLELLESELFGHEKGAFTGAAGLKIGKFEEANGGTLFLDEIAEMDLSIQSKILRAIQEREIVRVGGNKSINIDIRLITATHKNLSEEVKKGKFREDLFYRIVGLPIELPPLRQRENDVLVLAKFFVDSFCKNNHLKPLTLSEEAKVKIKKYSWPGNVRELKAVIELGCVMTEGKEIKADDLTFYEISETKTYNHEEKSLKEYEIEIISHYLNKYKDNVLLVAEKLDISKSKIYNLLKSNQLMIN
jgi:DNA-binding NtrC family response regulator